MNAMWHVTNATCTEELTSIDITQALTTLYTHMHFFCVKTAKMSSMQEEEKQKQTATAQRTTENRKGANRHE